jgi:AraC family transcriptional regulator, transcriptional activator of pobA
VEDISVRQHTMDELLAVVGENSTDNEFSTYFIQKEGQPIPLLYPFRSSHFTILLITEGRAHVQVNLINYVLHPCEMLVIAPDAVRQFKNLSFDCSVSVVGFSRDFLLHAGIHQSNVDAIELLALQNDPFVKTTAFTTSILDGLLHLLDAKRREKPASIYCAEIIRHSFAAFMLQVAETFRNSQVVEVKHNRKEDLLIQFLKLLPQHFREERSVQYYAENLFVTPKHLTQTVKDLTGRPAGAFIDDMVITEAKILLNNHSLSIAQIADELHFSDQFFFSKYFKKYAGVSPSQYRNGES